MCFHSICTKYEASSLYAVSLVQVGQTNIKDGWWLDPNRHMLLKPANEDSGVAQETLSVIGRRLSYLIPIDEHYTYTRGMSGSKDL